MGVCQMPPVNDTATLNAWMSSSNHLWTIIDGTLLMAILCGNTLTILAICCSRRLSNVMSNQFVLSLAISDMLVGLSLPYHMAFYLCQGLGTYKETCILRFVLIVLGCCASMCNLITIAVDRYISIVHPLHYCRFMTKRLAIIMVTFDWVGAVLMATVPAYWNVWNDHSQCELDQVLPAYYIEFIILPAFLSVWVILIFVYLRIWREAFLQVRRLRHINTGPSEWKSIQVVLMVLGSFSMCWLPFMIVACARVTGVRSSESSCLYKAAFSLAMANSCVNPFIYAWKNPEFRMAIKNIMRCQSPDRTPPTPSFFLANKMCLHTVSTNLATNEHSTVLYDMQSNA